jgi:hypothetical protein
MTAYRTPVLTENHINRLHELTGADRHSPEDDSDTKGQNGAEAKEYCCAL